MKSSIFLGVSALLAPKAYAAPPRGPVVVKERDDLALRQEEGEGPNGETYDEFCKPGWEAFTTLDGVQAIWDDRYVGADLTLFIHGELEGDQRNWLKILSDRYVNGEPTNVDSCAVIDETCQIPNEDDCRAAFNKDSPLEQNAYWILRAVADFHAKAKAIKGAVLDTNFAQSLEINAMMNAFSAKDEGAEDMVTWVKAALAVGTVLVPVGGAAKHLTGLVLGGMGVATGLWESNMEEQNEVDTSSLEVGLGQAYNYTASHLENMVRLLAGASDNEADYAMLPTPMPHLSLPDNPPVVKFLSGGWTMVDDDEFDFTKVREQLRVNLRYKLVDQALASAGWSLMKDEVGKFKRECNALGRQPMNRDGGVYCWMLMKPPTIGHEWVEATPDVYEAMEKFGIPSRDPYYQALVTCAEAKRNGPVSSDDVVMGEVPPCFVNLPVKILKSISTHPNGKDNSVTRWNVDDF